MIKPRYLGTARISQRVIGGMSRPHGCVYPENTQKNDELCCCKTECYGKIGVNVGQEFMMKLGFIKFGDEWGLSWMAWL
jgi:hypothetical protein